MSNYQSKPTKLDQLSNCIRFLSIDAVEKAQSGHPGMPMGMADVATILFKNHLKFDPKDPKWLDRDRLIISNGHGSMLIYSALYLLGYKDVSLKDLKGLSPIQFSFKFLIDLYWSLTQGVKPAFWGKSLVNINTKTANIPISIGGYLKEVRHPQVVPTKPVPNHITSIANPDAADTTPKANPRSF